MNRMSDAYNSLSLAPSSTAFTKSCCGPDRSDVNTTRAPSGDQTGESFRPGPVESGVVVARARSTSHSVDAEADADFTTAARLTQSINAEERNHGIHRAIPRDSTLIVTELHGLLPRKMV